MNNSICATVILYNPDNSVVTNIDSYATKVSKLFIVDNSEVQNTSLIKQLLHAHTNIEYISNNENLGIATALNIACDRALELEMDWILTMDQDSKFVDFLNFLLCFKTVIQTRMDIGIVAANHAGDASQITNSIDCSYIEKEIVITSGNLINLQYFNAIGRFNDELFIDMVDYDFSNKIILNNLKICLLTNHYIIHHIGEVFQRRNLLSGKIKSKIEHNAQRVYYMTRNRLYLSKIYAKQLPQEYNLFKTLNLLFIHDITKILLYEDAKIQKIYAKGLALYHYLMNKTGKFTL